MSLAEQLRRMQISGFCILEEVIPAAECEPIRASISQAVERERGNYSPPANIGFVPSVINHDQSFAAYLADERLMNLATAMLGPHVRISFTSAIVNEPGNARGEWHADWPFNQKNAERMIHSMRLATKNTKIHKNKTLAPRLSPTASFRDVQFLA